MTPTRVAVIGAGGFGKNHVRVVAENPRAILTHVVDTNLDRAREHALPRNAEPLADYRGLITAVDAKVDAAIVAVPTIHHAEVALALLEAGIDVLIEKPIAPTLAEADRLIDAAQRNGRILQVGHLERFNPVIAALERLTQLPLFFEIHRMSVFTLRSLDVDVVLDLMIHDLDLVLALVDSPIASVDAVGIAVSSPHEDIANARVRFLNGCVATITASRISLKTERRMRLFSQEGYLSANFVDRKSVV